MYSNNFKVKSRVIRVIYLTNIRIVIVLSKLIKRHLQAGAREVGDVVRKREMTIKSHTNIAIRDIRSEIGEEELVPWIDVLKDQGFFLILAGSHNYVEFCFGRVEEEEVG